MERKPTEKQLNYIRVLARRKGASLYLGNIKTLQQASRVIDALKNANANASAELREILKPARTT